MTAQGEFDSPFFARKADTPSLARLVFNTGFKRIPDFAGDAQSPPGIPPHSRAWEIPATALTIPPTPCPQS
jgi:hypothetical protein